jgi:hypothetical protein
MEMNDIGITPLYVESLRHLAFYLEGLKLAKGNILPLGTVTIDALWIAIEIMEQFSQKEK